MTRPISGLPQELPARVAVEHLTKSFGALVAVDDVSLRIGPGEMHCLLGENGAGKSTLSSCLYGLYRPDRGTIAMDGVALALGSPQDALRAGIGMVHQHFVLVPSFTVLENIVVGTGRGWRLGSKAAAEKVEAISAACGTRLDPDRLVADLSVGEQQWVEIVKALYLGARLLILDEPTAVLTPDESRRLVDVLRRLTESGISILLITHKMVEVMSSDRVSVLRRGRLVGTVQTKDTARDELTHMMVGRAVTPARRIDDTLGSKKVLSVSGLTLRRSGRALLDGVAFDLFAGEILGVAGVAGNGQDELFGVLAGIDAPSGGTILLSGERIDGLPAKAIVHRGVGYVPADRFRDGLVPDLSIAENGILGQQWERRWCKGLFLNEKRLDANARRAIAEFRIAASGPDAPCRTLSGGNAQKVILAREFEKGVRVLLCNQPTRGLDVGVIEFVHAELLRRRRQGCAILLASEELDDLFALCDRIAVMFKGAILRILPRETASLPEIGRLMAGHRAGISRMTALERAGWRLEARRDRGIGERIAVLALALAGALGVCALLLLAAGADPVAPFLALVKGGFGSWRAVAETLVKATPLIFTGLAAAVAFRARLWNIGAEGQLFAGAMLAYWCQQGLGATPALLQIPVVVAAAMAGGALYAGLAGVLKAHFRVDEVISTVMLNYIIVFALSMLLLRGPWSEAGGFFEQTAQVDPDSRLPVLLEKTRLHLGFLLALAASLVVAVLMRRTPLGYEIRAASSNLRALQVQGTSAVRLVLIVMLLSGALAGLAGATEVYGVHHRLKAGALTGYGYTGIIVAILGQLRPWGVVAAAILFGGLLNGATLMQITTGVPSALVYAIQAVLLLFFLVGWAASRLRLKRTARAE